MAEGSASGPAFSWEDQDSTGCIRNKLDTSRGCEVIKIRPHWE